MAQSAVGGCQCGDVRYAVAGPLARAYACHCRDCQKQSASAFSLSIPVERAKLRATGALSSFEKRAESGATTTCFFCGACGSRLFHVSSRSPEVATLKVGSLDDTSEIYPASHVWVSRKQPWVRLDPAIPSFDRQPADLATWRRSLFPPIVES
jgi:hypothetical protein